MGTSGAQKLKAPIQDRPRPTLKRLLRKEVSSHQKKVVGLSEEVVAKEADITNLTSNLEIFTNGKLDIEEAVTNLLAEKESLEGRLENSNAEFNANFHNIEAYAIFSNYFTNVGHHEVLNALRLEHPDLDISSLEAMFLW
ncbi:Uncharacterized protein Fot_11417 [Forsythia ovata]|uniref:Uncharacterized protein n=1 Tax=Forsythia ovata TaxID=205694 RepID=A0ABD1WK10_9LAMI